LEKSGRKAFKEILRENGSASKRDTLNGGFAASKVYEAFAKPLKGGRSIAKMF